MPDLAGRGLVDRGPLSDTALDIVMIAKEQNDTDAGTDKRIEDVMGGQGQSHIYSILYKNRNAAVPYPLLWFVLELALSRMLRCFQGGGGLIAGGGARCKLVGPRERVLLLLGLASLQ